MTVVVHYAEIGLKGKNRSFFENKLIQNIRAAARNNGVELRDVRKPSGRIVCVFKTGSEKKVEALLRTVFGIKYFGVGEEIESTEETLLKKTRQVVKRAFQHGHKTLAMAARRTDKRYPLSSSDLNNKLGAEAKQMGMEIDLENPDIKVFWEVGVSHAYVYTRKVPGLAGLPVSSSGKVLTLLSGGIDSPVAAWLMMKRGCRVDFLHFHTSGSNAPVLATKIGRIVEQLNRYQNASRLFLVPYHNYQVRTLGKIPEKLDLVVFKNFMFRLAQRVAADYGYKALVTGDSVGQVASQTLQNIAATDCGIEIPLLRPLVGLDKQEIIDLGKYIGTYGESIRDYKDCCSIIARKPSTAVKRQELEDAVAEARLHDVLERTLRDMEIFPVGPTPLEADTSPLTTAASPAVQQVG
jgi:thiamine biosynthesis protein ThiI